MRRIPAGVAAVPALAVLAVAYWWTRIIMPAAEFESVSADLFTQVYPMSYRAAERLLAGELPLWNPFQQCGHPFLATAQYGVLYPFNFPYLLLPVELGLEATVVLHLFAAGLFMYLYGRAISLVRFAALVAAVVYMLSGFVALQAMRFVAALAVCVWLPLGFVAIEKTLATLRLRWAALLAVAVAMPIFAGYPQTWTYSMYAMGAYSLFRLTGQTVVGKGRPAGVAAGVLLAGAVLGLCLAAAQVLPSFELQQLGPRQAGELSLAKILPFGVPAPRSLLAQAVNSSPPKPRQIYLGVLALLLMPASLGAARGRWRVACFWCLALLSVGVALWGHTPVFVLFRKLPGAMWFRVPQRILCVYAFAGAVLAGIGAQVIAAKERSPVAKYTGAAAATAAGVVWMVAVDMPALSQVYSFAGLACLWGLVLLSGRRLRAVLLAAVLGLVTWDLCYAHRNVSFRPYHKPEILRGARDVLSRVKSWQGLYRTYIPAPAFPWAMAKQGTLWGIYSIADYEPLSLDRHREFYRLLEYPFPSQGKSDLFTGNLVTAPDRPYFRLLDLMSVRFMVVRRGDGSLVRQLATAKWRLEYAAHDGGRLLYSNPDPLARAYVAHRAVIVDSRPEAFAAIRNPAFDFRSSVVIEGGRGNPWGGDDDGAPPVTPARIASYRPSQVVIRVRSAAPGYLVLTDTFYPGWKVTVDGKAEQIYRANYLFRAVAVGAGAHEVTFRYAPLSFRMGAGISLAALAVLVALLTAIQARRTK